MNIMMGAMEAMGGPGGPRGPPGQNGGQGGPMQKGPQANFFDPSQIQDGEFKFKGGKKLSSDEQICKKRYQQLSITALGNLTNATTSRILQTASNQTVYTMQVQVGTSSF
jgi:hypothetical protein